MPFRPLLRKLGKKISRATSRIVKPRRADVVDLSCGFGMNDLSALARKPGRELHGIDVAFKSDGIIIDRRKFKSEATAKSFDFRRSDMKIFAGDMRREVRAYRSNSVKLFQLKTVLSGFSWRGEELRREFTPMFKEIFRALKPNGRFKILDVEDFLEEPKSMLESVGFEVEIRKAKPRDLRGVWQNSYYERARKGEAYFYPHILTATKRKKKKRD